MLFSTEIMEELEKLDPQIRTAFLKVLKLIEKTIGPEVKAYAKEKYPHIKIMKSFEFELKYK